MITATTHTCGLSTLALPPATLRNAVSALLGAVFIDARENFWPVKMSHCGLSNCRYKKSEGSNAYSRFRFLTPRNPSVPPHNLDRLAISNTDGNRLCLDPIDLRPAV